MNISRIQVFLTQECLEDRMQIRLGGEMSRFTEAKTCRGEWSPEGWWNMSTMYFALEAEVGPGVKPSWTGLKDGRWNEGWLLKQPGLQERFGRRWNISLLFALQSVKHATPHRMEQPLKRRPMRCNALLLGFTMPYLLTCYVLICMRPWCGPIWDPYP